MERVLHVTQFAKRCGHHVERNVCTTFEIVMEYTEKKQISIDFHIAVHTVFYILLVIGFKVASM